MQINVYKPADICFIQANIRDDKQDDSKKTFDAQ